VTEDDSISLRNLLLSSTKPPASPLVPAPRFSPSRIFAALLTLGSEGFRRPARAGHPRPRSPWALMSNAKANTQALSATAAILLSKSNLNIHRLLSRDGSRQPRLLSDGRAAVYDPTCSAGAASQAAQGILSLSAGTPMGMPLHVLIPTLTMLTTFLLQL